ncbi:MAG TPA: gluconate 2-dehydrogenase subunit 3 family protein [Terriglobia bacterium]|nr:gluconate 2-dehydrogenase subunit 3 family protein [Terriglobia bacterium]
MDKPAATRRQFLIGSLTGASSVWLTSQWPSILAAHEHARRAAGSDGTAKFEFFSPEQAAEIEAMASQIIPTDDSPGAREAGVIYFIDRALSSFDRHQQSLYLQGLNDLPAKTRELFPNSGRFSELSSPQQIQVLTAIEKTPFFAYVRLHTIMGYLANPEYGGNHDQVGWKLIGFTDEHSFQPPFGYYDLNK